MVNAQFSKHVASLETREGCPITPGASFTKTFYLVPVASSNKDRRGKSTMMLCDKGSEWDAQTLQGVRLLNLVEVHRVVWQIVMSKKDG